MATAMLCTGLLGLLVFGLGFAVSMTRGKTETIIGTNSDPTDRLYKMVRAHGKPVVIYSGYAIPFAASVLLAT